MPIRRIKKKYKGGNVLTQQIPQQQTPVQIIQPTIIPKKNLISFQKKIRINVTPEFKSIIEAPEEAEYILSERLNALSKYGDQDIYRSSFGKDEETGTPVDIYTEYVYERLKDLKLPYCQQLKYRGDKIIPGGFFSSASSNRQSCTNSIKTLIKDDNRILQSWIDNINQNGIKFLENVGLTIEKIKENIKELEITKNEKLVDLKDTTNNLNDNIKGIDREMQQKLQEITRLTLDKETELSSKIKTEIEDLLAFIKQETSIVQDIEKIDYELIQIDKEIQEQLTKLNKTQTGLNNTFNQLKSQGIDFEKLIQDIQRSIQMYAMTGGRKKPKKTKKLKKTKKSKKSKKPKKSKKSKKTKKTKKYKK